MAPFGKIFTRELNPRTTAILAVAKANGLELETVEVDAANPSAEVLKHNKLGKVPTFVGSDGYVLTETIAISIYITSQNEKTTLLGKTKQDYASILKWMSFFNSEIISNLGAWYRPLLGLDPYNKRNIDEAIKASQKAVAIVEEHLVHNTYLVGERITLADLFATSIISRGFQYFYDKEWRAENPNITRWYETVYNQPIYLNVSKPLEFLEKPKLVNVPPKKAEQPKAKKAEKAEKPKAQPKAAPKPAPAADEEDEPAPAPKPKHPIDLLPRSEYPLDEWKRFYSNNPADEAMEYFWKTVPFTDYSIWQVDYKYNDELRLVFMSNNLIGGFNNRLEGSRKYIFGAASVYGENHDSVISGAFVIRGDEYLPAFDVAPDYESFDFKKLDPSNPEDRAIVESRWKFDKPVVVGDKEYKYADGKVFK